MVLPFPIHLGFGVEIEVSLLRFRRHHLEGVFLPAWSTGLYSVSVQACHAWKEREDNLKSVDALQQSMLC